MPSITRIDSIIQRGRGKEARVFGQSFDVYRLGPNSDSSGIVGLGSRIATRVLGEFEKLASRSAIEIELPGKVLHYTATIDMRPFREGDVFVQRTDSYKYERLVLTCCSNRPAPDVPVFAATPIYATITRPKPNATNQDSGRTAYSAPIKAFEFVLTLTGQYYEFAQTGDPVTVPVGMVMERLRDYPGSEDATVKLYDDTRRQTWTMFVPVLDGTMLLSRDVITGANGDRFEVTGVMPQYTSYTGQVVTTQRLRN